jgi:retron-type reverse transcriptase
MIPKPGKNLSEVESYRPISLLPIMSKLFDKLILKCLKPIINKKRLVPTHQFGFRNNHSTIDQVHHITDIIEKTLEGKRVYSAVFLDVAQAFDRVCHNGLLHKLRSTLHDHYYRLLESYLTNRHFRVKHEDSYSELKFIKAGVPQGSVLEPVLYLLYINDLPTTLYSVTATFADDTAVMAVGESDENSTKKLQSSLNKIAIWTRKW